MYRIGKEEVEEVRKVLLSGHLFRVGEGVEGHLHEVDQFEREWAQTIGTDYALCMAGGEPPHSFAGWWVWASVRVMR